MYRLLIYIINKLRYHKLVKFNKSVTIGRKANFGGMNVILSNTDFYGTIGYGSYISDHCSIDGKIGNFTSIAPYVRCNPGMHPYKYPYVTTSGAFYSLRCQNGGTFAKKQLFEEFRYADKQKKYHVIIEDDCWIGEGAFLVGGITIKSGAIVLAHAVVTKDVPEYAIVGGVPAKILNYRYDDETIKFLLKFKWWNMPTKWLAENWEMLCDLDKLKKYSGFYE